MSPNDIEIGGDPFESPEPTDYLWALEPLAMAGVVVSVAFGPSRGGSTFSWSVDCLNTKTEESFERPFAADDIEHAYRIAIAECVNRGWVSFESISSNPSIRIIEKN